MDETVEAEAQAPEIHFAVEGGLGTILLDRPKALNALTMEMILAMRAQLAAWAGDDSIKAVVIEGAGEKAFCAGGDVRALYDSRKDPHSTYRADFYREEYHLNREIFRFPKPYIALIDGIDMGGGVGVSVHGSHRVVTERTLFAMPETGIGLFPDVGGGYFLPRLPRAFGVYMGLTGARVKAADCRAVGIATHYVPSEMLPELKSALAKAQIGSDAASDVAAVLETYAADPGPSAYAGQMEEIEHFFGAGSVHAIVAALEQDNGEFAKKTLETLRGKCPLSLCVSCRQMREGGELEFEDVMVMEYRLSQRFMSDTEFFEGIRAIIVDKDNAPRWRHEKVEDVTFAEIERFFAPLGPRDLTFE